MRDVYQEVTDRIIQSLERGTAPWLRPWRDDKSGAVTEPHNALSGRQYNGINLLILGTMPYQELGWLTFKQALELGGNVRKGEHGTLIIFWKFEQRKDEATGKLKTIPFARGYTVFNLEQCENIASDKIKRPVPPVPGDTDINALVTRMGVTIRHGGNKAFYAPSVDQIVLPSVNAFKSLDHYRSTLAHEGTHATGHPARCNRQFGARFGDAAYAFEELVAEIGSAFLCAQHGIPLEGLRHPDYIANWLNVLKGDKRAIFTASSKARQANAFINGASDTEEEETHAIAA